MNIDPSLITSTIEHYMGYIWAHVTIVKSRERILGKLYLTLTDKQIQHFRVEVSAEAWMNKRLELYMPDDIIDPVPLTRKALFKYQLLGKI